MVFDASGLAAEDDVYTLNPELLRNFSVKLDKGADNVRFFVIVDASYDEVNDQLRCSVDASGQALDEFGAIGDDVSLVPHFIRVLTDGILDSYPEDTAIFVRFDATKIDPVTGDPSETASFSSVNGDLTADITDLNLDKGWDFVRFQVEFDLDTQGGGVDLNSPRPGLDHLRTPFRF